MTPPATPELAGDLLVVVPEMLAPAFRLSGARTVAATAGDVPALVAAELAAGRPGVIAVHPQLWERVPEPVRRDWERRLTPLVVALPADTGTAAPSRRHAVRELLARSVGYEITFTPRGGSS